MRPSRTLRLHDRHRDEEVEVEAMPTLRDPAVFTFEHRARRYLLKPDGSLLRAQPLDKGQTRWDPAELELEVLT